MQFWKTAWFKDIARAVLVALLVSVLTVLGYDVHINQQNAFGVMSLPGKTTNLYALTVTDDLIAGGDITSTGDITAGDDLTVTDKANVNEIVLTPATSITATQNMTLTFTTSAQPMAAADSLSFGIISGGTAGDILILHNSSDTTITITDTGTIMLSGNISLAQYDTAVLYCDGTNWLQLAESNN